MEEFVIGDNTFRIKKMNAIETLALRSQISFDNYESTLEGYSIILSKIEVKVKDSWLTVKQGNNYYPAGIEDDIQAIEALILKVMDYLKKVFTKSNASKKETK